MNRPLTEKEMEEAHNLLSELKLWCPAEFQYGFHGHNCGIIASFIIKLCTEYEEKLEAAENLEDLLRARLHAEKEAHAHHLRELDETIFELKRLTER